MTRPADVLERSVIQSHDGHESGPHPASDFLRHDRRVPIAHGAAPSACRDPVRGREPASVAPPYIHVPHVLSAQAGVKSGSRGRHRFVWARRPSFESRRDEVSVLFGLDGHAAHIAG